MTFPIVMYRYESWTIEKAGCQRIDAFELWCWRRLLRVPRTAKRSNWLIQDINPEYPLVFPVVMYGCESWTVKKAERRRIDAFELWCWRRLLRVPWTTRRSNQSILKEIKPGISLEGMMLNLKLQYFSHLIRRTDSFEKTWCWETLKVGGEGDSRGWDGWMTSLRLSGYEFEWTPGAGDGQGGLVCCDSWGCKESNTTEWLNWTEGLSIKGGGESGKMRYRTQRLRAPYQNHWSQGWNPGYSHY